MTYRHALTLEYKSRVRRKADGLVGKVIQYWDGTDTHGRKLLWMLVQMPNKQCVKMNHRDVELIRD